MSSRLNPREYDLGELRDAVRESPRRDDGPENGPGDGLADDLSAIADLLHEDPSDGTATEGTPEARPAGPRSEPPSSGDESGDRFDDGDDPSGADSSRRVHRPSVGRMRRNAARFARSTSRDRRPDGEPRRRGEIGEGERSGRGPTTAAGSDGRAATASRAPGTRVGGFELLAAGTGGDLERPYLDRLPTSYRAQLEIFEWLEGLLDTCGREATGEALAFYESVGWLSEGAWEDLEEFLEGLSPAEPPDPRPLGVDDHRESLRYVARLAHRVDR